MPRDETNVVSVISSIANGANGMSEGNWVTRFLSSMISRQQDKVDEGKYSGAPLVSQNPEGVPIVSYNPNSPKGLLIAGAAVGEGCLQFARENGLSVLTHHDRLVVAMTMIEQGCFVDNEDGYNDLKTPRIVVRDINLAIIKRDDLGLWNDCVKRRRTKPGAEELGFQKGLIDRPKKGRPRKARA